MIRSLLRLSGLAIGLFAVACAWAAEPAAQEPVVVPPAAVVVHSYQISTSRTGSQVNWLTGQLEVVGIGYANSKGELAKMQACANAMSIMLNEARRGLPRIQVDATTALAASLNDDAQKRTAEGVLSNLMIIDELWNAKERAYKVVGVLPLYGQSGFTYLATKSIISGKTLELPVEQLSILKPIPRGHTPQRFTAPYTGIIINADDVAINPCLFPRILRFDGKEMWGPANAAPAPLIDGPVRYAVNLEDAITRKLAGDKPLILEAVGVGQQCYPVLNVDDVYLALYEQKFHGLLNELPLIITLGQE
ncbi:MAG: hypothetical protein ACYDBB_22680 [Armatimonadota bacterium]